MAIPLVNVQLVKAAFNPLTYIKTFIAKCFVPFNVRQLIS